MFLRLLALSLCPCFIDRNYIFSRRVALYMLDYFFIINTIRYTTHVTICRRMTTVEIDLLIDNARIITMDDSRPQASSLGVWNGFIIGLDEQLNTCKARNRIDARNAVITPGFYDVHNHMAAFGQRLQEIDAGAFNSLDELYEEIYRRATSSKEEWITGSGYDQTKLGAHPRRVDLDRAGLGKKVLLTHRTSH